MRLGSALLVLALTACGATTAVPVEPAPSDPDVVSLLPSGPTSVIVAAPSALFEAPASRALITRLVPDERFEVLRMQHGIDLRTLEQLVVASYDDGDVFVLRGPFLARVAVAEIGHRMVPVESHAEAPRARVAGVFRGTRVDAIAIGPHTLAVIVGPPALAGRLLATLDGEAASFDADQVRVASPFAYLRPRPLALPLESPLAMLLAREQTMLVTAGPSDAATISVRVRFTGAFPPGAEVNFRRLVASLADTDLGRAVGMSTALSSLAVEVADTRAELAAEVDATSLARGLWLAMGAELEQALADP